MLTVKQFIDIYIEKEERFLRNLKKVERQAVLRQSRSSVKPVRGKRQ